MTNTMHHDDIDITLLGDGNFRGTCQWHEDVCTTSPDAYITSPSDTEMYCLRHYAITLSQIAEVHVPSCSHSLAEHITSFGRLTA